MTASHEARGMIAVDKIGCKVLFLNPQTYQTETVIDGFQRTVHELLVVPETGRAYVPIFGDGIHGRNPNPGHTLWVIDLINRKLVCDIDLRPNIAPHTVRLGPDSLLPGAVVATAVQTDTASVFKAEYLLTPGHFVVVAEQAEDELVDLSWSELSFGTAFLAAGSRRSG